MNTFKTLNKLYETYDRKGSYHIQIILIVILGLLSTVSSIALGMLTQGVLQLTTDNAIYGFIIFLVTSLFAALIDWLRSNRLNYMVENIKAVYRTKTTSILLGAKYAYVQGLQAGELISRMNTDVDAASRASDLLITAIRNILIPCIICIMMLVLDWRFAVSFMLPFILVYLSQKLSAKGQDGIISWRQSFANMSSVTNDLIVNRTMLKANGLQGWADTLAQASTQDYRQKGNKGLGKMYMVTIPGLLVNCLPLFCSAAMGAFLLFKNEITISSFVTMFTLAQIATNELLNLPNVFVNMPTCIVSANRLFEIWSLPEENTGTITKCSNDTVVDFNDVTFKYSIKTNDAPVINHLSFQVQSGEKVAFVGPSGCGKSTVLKLISGLYQPISGNIQLWGNTLRDWDLNELRNRMSFMQQETFIFSGTVKENIVFAKPNASTQELVAAAEKASLMNWINEQPDKWDTQVGERGSFLSGGLKQRVGLARMFIAEVPLLLMDEATAALDTKNENEILTILNNIGDQCTQIIVAHRLAAVKDSDRILVMDGGQILEEGSHQQLLAKNGLYAALYFEQEGGVENA